MNRRISGWTVANVTLTHLVLAAAAFTMVVPFLWMISTSLKKPGAVFQIPPSWVPDPAILDNYLRAFRVMPFGRFFLNSAIVASCVTLLQLITCSLAAYAFARLRFPGRDLLFLVYLGTLMIPNQVTIIPNFILMRLLGWVDTYQGLIVPQAFSAFGTFLLRQFFLTIPQELEDAARIDGCSYLHILWRIILPLSKPALVALAIFTFLGQWNNFLWPLIMTYQVEMSTLTVGLRALQGQYNTAWTLLMAGSVISLLPVLVMYVFGQKYFVRGVTLTGIGGR
ncbi:MAG: carbohydrate ABC transporter permease [Deinococcus sp.]|nr:carbohydrate ABC transporter permease [Deinococcus sp.]